MEDNIDLEKIYEESINSPIPSRDCCEKRYSSNLSEKEVKKRGAVCFIDDSLMDINVIDQKIKNDFVFFEKFKKLNRFTKYEFNQEPFSYMYERMWSDLTFSQRMFISFRNCVRILNAKPFHPDGECRYFEYETLYRPQKCQAYVLQVSLYVEKQRAKWEKIRSRLNMDKYQKHGDEEHIIQDEQGIKLGKYFRSDKKPTLNRDRDERGIPHMVSDRSIWPDNFFKDKRDKI